VDSVAAAPARPAAARPRKLRIELPAFCA